MLLGAAIAAATIYLAALFWLASWRDRSDAARLQKHSGLIYGLSLAVYCTSWTFFGGVGTAATSGLEFLPIYLGPILVFTLGFGLIRRILLQAQAQHSTSIADFLSARYGKSASVAAMVTIIATVGSLPYMALQLQSVGNALLALDPALSSSLALDEIVLLTAAVMALFAILFGSRRADRAGSNSGLVLTIAVEAAVKLVALVAVALLGVVVLTSGDVSLPQETFSAAQIDARFAVLTLIAGCAALCLPRQFHMTFVEAETSTPSRSMRWVFPAYLVLTAIVILPIVMAGLAVLPQGTNPDMIVMALPLATGNEALALLVFIGGFSAAVGMIIVASVALSIMITNDLIAPLILRETFEGGTVRPALTGKLLQIRRMVVGGLLLCAYLFYLSFGTVGSLAGLGTLAFAAAAQFAPGLVFGMVSRIGNRNGMIAGLGTGFALWLVLLIIPPASGTQPMLQIHSDTLVSGVILSLGGNIAAYWIGSLASAPNLIDEAQAAAFVGFSGPVSAGRELTRKRVADVRLLLRQFVGNERADEAIAAQSATYRDSDTADDALLAMAERRIAGVVGASSSRMLVSSWARSEPVPMAEVMAMFDETHRRLSFSGELLQIAIENIDQGVALVDSEMNLVAWNSRYQALFGLPDELVMVGTPIAELIRFNLRQSGLDDEAIAEQIERRLDHMRAGREHQMEREQHDGRIMRIVGNPAPGGGYVTSYTDVTADRRAEQALEDKVLERTIQLSEANAALEQATRSKTRFLAAASHDLIQPLNAARLFASALGEEVRDEQGLARLVADIDGSIASADRLIRSLLDISRLDGGGIVPKFEMLPLNEILDELEREFAVQAQAKGLRFRKVPSSASVRTDRALLTSVLRNLVSNAIRYTETGGVLIGTRRKGQNVLLCVYDTGRGIADDQIERMFEEFQRGPVDDKDGLGLGLAIVRRAVSLLDIDVQTTSELGRGTRFALTLSAQRGAARMPDRPRATRSALTDAGVLVVDNDPKALQATSALLEKWGLSVVCAATQVEALRLCPMPPDVAIMDFRLDGDARGDTVYRALCEAWGAQPPAILMTAEDSAETEQAAGRMLATRLLKPSSPAALRALLSNCVNRRAEAIQADAGSAAG